ncbi:MAG: CPBP family intramembrane glutamic endopeptidase [Candidatus Bathyarchaeia archaeon]
MLVATATALALGYIGVDYRDPPYPLSLISIPINEVTILLTTLMFFKRNRADLRQLGFRRVSVGMCFRMFLLSIAMLVLTATVALGQNLILGPDPSEQLFTKLVSPRTPIQLAALVILSMLLVGPVEELFARGYIQQGLENSLGKAKGWLLASLLFGVLHALNVLRAIMPTLVAGLFLGYVWQRTGRNTTAVSIMHGAYDSIALTLAFLAAV